MQKFEQTCHQSKYINTKEDENMFIMNSYQGFVN